MHESMSCAACCKALTAWPTLSGAQPPSPRFHSRSTCSSNSSSVMSSRFCRRNHHRAGKREMMILDAPRSSCCRCMRTCPTIAAALLGVIIYERFDDFLTAIISVKTCRFEAEAVARHPSVRQSVESGAGAHLRRRRPVVSIHAIRQQLSPSNCHPRCQLDLLLPFCWTQHATSVRIYTRRSLLLLQAGLQQSPTL
jgi:hypothetical protein